LSKYNNLGQREISMNKTALIIGATGLIGRALVDELLAKEGISKVIALTRRPLDISHEKFENHQVDFSKLYEEKSIFKHVDLFFSCLGTTKKQVGSIDKQRVVDLDYQYQAALMAKEAGVEGYFLISSSAASSASLSPYLKMKGELEDKVLALSFKRCVIFRPSLLLGHREEQRAGEFWAGKLMPLLAYLPYLKRYRPIQGAEVAAKMASVACRGKNVSNKQGSNEQRSCEFYNLDEIF